MLWKIVNDKITITNQFLIYSFFKSFCLFRFLTKNIYYIWLFLSMLSYSFQQLFLQIILKIQFLFDSFSNIYTKHLKQQQERFMTPALQYKHVIIRTSKCLLKGEEINDIIFHDKGDNQGQYCTIYLSSILGSFIQVKLSDKQQ